MLSLAYPSALFLLLLMLPVLWLHMRRRRTLTVPSLLIWRDLEVKAASKRAWRWPPPSWPLFLQLAAIAALALALAAPSWGGRAAQPDHVVYLLDTSGSMRTGDAFEAALAELERAMAAWPAGVRVSLMAVGGRPSWSMVRALAEHALDWRSVWPRQGDGAADWAAASERLPGVLRAQESSLIVLMSDAAPSAEVLDQLARAAAGAELRSRAFGRASEVPSAAFLDLALLQGEGQGAWRLVGRLAAPPATAEPLDAALVLAFAPAPAFDFLPILRRELRATAAGSAFDIPIDLPPNGLLRLSIDGSPLSAADAYWYLRPSDQPFRVLHAREPSPSLARALAGLPGAQQFRAEDLQASLALVDLLVTEQPVEGRVDRLRFAPAIEGGPAMGGGHLLEAGGAWPTAHPLALGGGWSSLEAMVGELAPIPGAEVVVDTVAGPLVQAVTTAEGREVYVGFALEQSNWSTLDGFPAFIARAATWMRTAGQGACTAGQACTLPTPAAGAVALRGPDDLTALRLGSAAAWAVDAFWPERAGVYRWVDRNGAPIGDPLVVHPAFGLELPWPPVSELADAAATDDAGGPARLPLWRPLLILAALLLAVDLVLAQRASRSGRQWDPRRRQATAVRLLAMAALVLAFLALRLPLPQFLDQRAVVVSGAAGAGQAELLAVTQTPAAGAWRAGTPSTVVWAGDQVSVLRDNDGDALEEGPAGAAAGADLEAAVAQALAMLRPDAPAELFLVDQGLQTRGEVRDLAPLLAERQATLHRLPSPIEGEPPLWVAAVQAPDDVRLGERFSLTAQIVSDQARGAVVRLWRDGELLREEQAALVAGVNPVLFTLQEEEAGGRLFEVEVDGPADAEQRQPATRDGVWLQVEQRPKVLLVTNEATWGQVLVSALEVQGFEVTATAPSRSPFFLDQWLAYDAYVLMNLPAIDLQPVQQELLDRAVAEFGRSLLILGGENSFGPGGYYETVLEEMSPLSSRVPRDAPKVAMAFVLDRSGSMQQQAGDLSRLEIAKQATLSAVGLLQEESQVAVVTFDVEPTLLVPLQERIDLPAIEGALRNLVPGGGTSMYPAMVMALDQLRGLDMPAHMVVMSDGLSQPGDFDSLLGELAAAGVTMSTVAVGDGADVQRLQDIARSGGGTFHASRDARSLPSILAQEAMMLSGDPIEEGRAQPAWAGQDAVFSVSQPSVMPSVDGFVLTTAKPEATLYLEVPDPEGELFPLFASWRYGIGHVFAFTSHGAGAWTRDWLAMPSYPLLWAQSLRTFQGSAGGASSRLYLLRDGDAMQLSLEAFEAGEPADLGPRLSSNVGDLLRTAPGVYHRTVPLEASGTQTVEVQLPDGSTVGGSLHVGYLRAEAPLSWASPAAADLALAVGGEPSASGQDLQGSGSWSWRLRQVWPYLALLATALFLLDLMLRYAARVPSLRKVS